MLLNFLISFVKITIYINPKKKIQRMKHLWIIIILIFLVGCRTAGQTQDQGTPPPKTFPYKIYSVHEQVSGMDQVPRVLDAMDKAGISTMVLLGSPEATFIYVEGFQNHHDNNNQIMRIMHDFPGRFIAFPTIDPRNTSELLAFQSYMNDGGTGLRLFSGQWAWFYRYIGPVNRTELNPVFDYASDRNIPVMYNMNPGEGTLQAEFEDVLQRYPDVKFVCPHFCLSSINSTRFEYLMDTYPNLYTDISFGHFFEDGLKRISRNTTKFHYLFDKYQNRIMFGADMVITPNTGNSSEWIYNLTMCYRHMLEEKQYNCTVKIGKVFNVSARNLHGLALNDTMLKKIYHDNPEAWMGIGEEES